MNQENKIKTLVSALLDDNISEAQAAELDHLLQSDEQARIIYRRMMAMDLQLQENVELDTVMSDLPSPEEMPEKFRSTRFQLHIFQAAAACLAVALMISFFRSPKEVKGPGIVKTLPIASPKKVLAKIIEVSPGTQWKGRKFKKGDDLSVGNLEFESGSVVLQYKHGAEVKLEGRVHYRLKSLSLAELKYGQLAANVPEAAQGFTIDAPKATIVDLGTEFAMNVNTAGESQVFVYEGEVESSLIGEDGNSLKNIRLYAQEGVQINGELQQMSLLDNASDFIRLEEQAKVVLQVSEDYIKTVKADEPLAYWRFEEGAINEMSNDYTASFKGDLIAEEGALTFAKDSQAYLVVEQALANINEAGYSAEFWINPQEYRNQMALASLVSAEDPVKHLLYTELTGKKGALRHAPFNLRMSSRFPADKGSGTNCFSNSAFVTGEWSHYVFVKDDRSLKIYINGKLANSIKTKLGSDDQAYQFCFGRIDPERSSRYFVGQMDELAIYNYPLNAEQIAKHYQAQ
ncbi:FecR domain-containing protein [Lentisphaera profundi]|uniref:FecR domain-containing protein n=1 Tax=Lentisphaera profundi TaxID=1658616 RepID=A0ABY7VNB3_9BACT|nr:LamG-like jellyroll fold domain-containing protein [Lentisphaera profundi]WDE95598.1 FecR domain-containing protein [Lentisphaera profundi]